MALSGLAAVLGGLVLAITYVGVLPGADIVGGFQALGVLLLAVSPVGIVPALVARARIAGGIAAFLLILVALVALVSAAGNAAVLGPDQAIGGLFFGAVAWLCLTPIVLLLAARAGLVPKWVALAVLLITILSVLGGPSQDSRTFGGIALFAAWIVVGLSLLRSGIRMWEPTA